MATSDRVLALKYRPQTFDEVVGQRTVTTTLRNAIASGRIGHAFLLSGARGVGKTTTARILAKSLNCAHSPAPTPDPCGECSSCREIALGKALDVQEIDGATNNSVDDVRELRESARYNPARDRFKIWIIDEVHMLSAGAFNALLKTLEEPPPRVKFIFATTEYHKLPETILSRCQQYEFRLIPARELAAHLREVAGREGIAVSDRALDALARAAEGSVRDALSLFDQVLSFSATGREVRDEDLPALLGLVDRELLARAAQAVAAQDCVALLDLVEGLSEYGADYRRFARELLLYLREALLVKLAPPQSRLLEPILPEERESLAAVGAALSEDDLLRMLDLLDDAGRRLADKATDDPRVTLELALLRMAQMRRLMPFAELVARVEGLAAGAPVAAPAAAPSARAGAPAPSRLAPMSTSPAARRAPALHPPGARGAPPADAVAPAASAGAPAPPAAADDDAGTLLAAMLAAARPSQLAALRTARVRLEGASLVLSVAPDFLTFAQMHVDEYQDLARKAAGRPLQVRVVPGEAPEPAAPSPEEVKKERLLREAQREPAVQEALDLFGAKVVGVRESDRE